MAITLRTEKGTALTYAEMDKNFSSFFYSASVDFSTDQLQLWYTGSVDLSTPGENFNPGRVINIPLNPSDNAVTALTVAGGPGQVQFRDYNNSILAASSNFIYNSTGNLGIGTPSPIKRVHIRGHKNIPATLRLESAPFNTLASYVSSIEFYEGALLRGEIGRLSDADNDIYINTAPGGNLRFKVQDDLNTGAWTTTGLGIGTNAPERKLHVVGEGFITTGLGIGVGAQNHAIYAFSNIGPATPQKSFKSFARFANFGGPTGGSVNGINMITYRQEVGNDWISTGTRIQQLVDATYMGYVQFSGPDNLYGISIGTGNSKEDAFGAIHEPGHPDIQERLRIDQYGNVTINKPVANAKVDINGNTIVTGSFTATANAAVGTSLTTGTSATVGTTLTVGSTATIGNVPLNADSNPRILVQSQTSGQVGQVQYITGVVPKGAIMMWNSATAPSGWAICDGNGGAPIGDVVIPDLRERFIVGAGGKNDEVVTYDFTSFTVNSSFPFVVNAQGQVQPAYIQGTFTKVNDTSMVQNPTSTTTAFYSNTNQGTPGTPNVNRQYALYSLVGNSAATSYFLVYHQGLDTYILYRGYVPQDGASITTGYPYSLFPQGSIAVLSQTGNTVTHRPNISTIQWKADINGYTVGEKGGFNNVKLHTSELPSHTHLMPQGNVQGNQSGPFTYTSGDDGTGGIIGSSIPPTNPTGGNFPHENRPPYYALAFIIYTGV